MSDDWAGGKVDPAEWGITALEYTNDSDGLSRKQGFVHTGGNSGYQGINLAYLLGAERIILLGFDMSPAGDKDHWFGNHPEPLRTESPYASFANKFRSIIPSEYGIEIWNCSRRTALDCFPIFDLDRCLELL